MVRVLGIDPGLSSAGAAVIEIAAPDMFNERHVFTLLDVFDIPTTGEDARKRIHVGPLAAFIRKWNPDICGIERAQSMSYYDPKTRQRRAQANNFNYGRGVGAIEATVLLAGVKMFTVEPSVWKKTLGLSGGTDKKKASIALAKDLFSATDFFSRQKDHNRAEAALISYFTGCEYLGIGGQRGQAA